jgi:PEP-CTERM motif-containing protein
MKRLFPPAVACMLVLVAPGMIPAARAGLLSPSEAAVLIQSTASDTDAMLLSLFYGFQAGQPLNYSSSLTTTAWSGTLSGTYIGTGLSLTYLGDLSNYPSGPVTWTSSGSYGSQSWSGSGSATIADTSSTTFQVGFVYAMTVGSNSASISYQIPGTVTSNGTIMYGDPGNGAVGTGSLTLNGVLGQNELSYSYLEIPDPHVWSRITRSDRPGVHWVNSLDIDAVTGAASGIIIGPLKDTPEPSSLLLMGFGLLGLVRAIGRRERAMSQRPETDLFSVKE